MTDEVCVVSERAGDIRREALKMIHDSPAGHPGGALSMADIMAVIYFGFANLRPDEPDWRERDRVILSKGHACAAYYAALGLRGYFDRDEFKRFRRINGLLEGHPSVTIPGVDAPSGSLGMGLAQGLGMALAAQKQGEQFGVYVILGDGDMQEGCTWEALMAAGHHKTGRLCAILDYNGIQQESTVEETMDYAPVAEKVRAFRWAVEEIDGHDCRQIRSALDGARVRTGQPTFIVASTTKGKGVSFMENTTAWHGSVPLGDEDLQRALAELADKRRALA